MAAIIEGKKYELIRRNKSRYRRGDGLRRVDRGRDGPRVAKGFPRHVALLANGANGACWKAATWMGKPERARERERKSQWDERHRRQSCEGSNE